MALEIVEKAIAALEADDNGLGHIGGLDLPYLGGGLYGRVFAVGEDKVIKVSQRGYFDGWLRYAALILRGYENLHTPIIYSLKSIAKKDEPKIYYAALMERLTNDDKLYEANYESASAIVPETITNAIRFDDMHRGNMLFRDGIPVVTDPASGVRWLNPQLNIAVEYQIAYGIDYTRQSH